MGAPDRGIRSSRSDLLILELIRSKMLEAYYYGMGPKPPGEEGGPEPYLADVSAVASMIGSVYFPSDEGNDPEGHGPGGPVMRDILTTIAVARLASSLSNKELGQRLRSVALEHIVNQAQELQRGG